MTEGVNLFDGKPCPTCAARLRVVKVYTVLPTPSDDGQIINSSSYECEGPERHLWSTLFDLETPGRFTANLTPEKPRGSPASTSNN